MGAVFDQLNRGSSVTAGLKKVDKSEMTHKNPSLRAAVERRESSEGLARSRSRGPETKPKPDSMRTKVGAAASKKEPKKELDGNKWIIVSHSCHELLASTSLDITDHTTGKL